MNITTLVEKVVGDLGDKKRWRAHKERVRRLPDGYRDAIEALERYLTYFGAITRGDVLMTMLEDLADLFEQSAADGTPIRSVVGDDPVEFAEAFLRNYSEGRWIAEERTRLAAAIDRAAATERPAEEA